MSSSAMSITPTLGEERYFFRTADKMRLQGCVHAVSHEGQSLTLYCEEEALMDHYAQMLLTDLRSTTPQHKVEVYFPTSPDSLVERFNEVLAGLSVQDASKASTLPQPGQIWVIHDPTVLADHELQLLGKLIQNLPGSNIRLVLLLAGATSHSFVMASLKRRMLRWDIELPSVEQALTALQVSEQSGQLIHLRRLLAKICAQDPQAAAVADTLALDPNKQFKPMRIPRLPAGQVTSSNETAQDKARKAWKTLPWKNLSWKNFLPVGHQGLKIAAVVIIALVISTAMMMWTQPGAFGLATGKPVAAKPALSNPPIEITEWKNDPGLSAQGASTSSQAPVSPTVRQSWDAPKPNLKPEAKPAALGAGATRGQVPATVKPEAPAKTRFNDLKVAGQWMQELPPQGYVIVYGTSPTLAEAQALQKKYASLAGSIIVQTFKDTPANIRYTVSSEGYDSAALAYRDLKSDTFPAGIWVRPTKDLQKELVQANPTDRRM